MTLCTVSNYRSLLYLNAMGVGVGVVMRQLVTFVHVLLVLMYYIAWIAGIVQNIDRSLMEITKLAS